MYIDSFFHGFSWILMCIRILAKLFYTNPCVFTNFFSLFNLTFKYHHLRIFILIFRLYTFHSLSILYIYIFYLQFIPIHFTFSKIYGVSVSVLQKIEFFLQTCAAYTVILSLNLHNLPSHIYHYFSRTPCCAYCYDVYIVLGSCLVRVINFIFKITLSYALTAYCLSLNFNICSLPLVCPFTTKIH